MLASQARSGPQLMQILSIKADNLNLQTDKQLSFFRLVYVQEGTGWLLTKQGKQTIHENCLVWLCPEEDWELNLNADAQGHHCILPNLLHRFLNYDPQLIYHPQFLRLLASSGFVATDVETSSLFGMLLKTMGTELERYSFFGPEIIERYFKIFMLHLLRCLECGEQEKIETYQVDIVHRFQDLLEKNFTTKKQVSDYAAELFISPNYLNAIVRRLTGHPVSHHIKQRIVLEAKRKCAYTDMCMKQVAYSLGFDDIPHFSKYFKAATGMNFSDFKQEKYLLPMAG